MSRSVPLKKRTFDRSEDLISLLAYIFPIGYAMKERDCDRFWLIHTPKARFFENAKNQRAILILFKK